MQKPDMSEAQGRELSSLVETPLICQIFKIWKNCVDYKTQIKHTDKKPENDGTVAKSNYIQYIFPFKINNNPLYII